MYTVSSRQYLFNRASTAHAGSANKKDVLSESNTAKESANRRLAGVAKRALRVIRSA
jgi:hypothetical protein